jgi:hypothetical protein
MPIGISDKLDQSTGFGQGQRYLVVVAPTSEGADIIAPSREKTSNGEEESAYRPQVD